MLHTTYNKLTSNLNTPHTHNLEIRYLPLRLVILASQAIRIPTLTLLHYPAELQMVWR